jgi:hypothetical protein
MLGVSHPRDLPIKFTERQRTARNSRIMNRIEYRSTQRKLLKVLSKPYAADLKTMLGHKNPFLGLPIFDVCLCFLGVPCLSGNGHKVEREASDYFCRLHPTKINRDDVQIPGCLLTRGELTLDPGGARGIVRKSWLMLMSISDNWNMAGFFTCGGWSPDDFPGQL